MPRARINYELPQTTYDLLVQHCTDTGRKSADVVRHILSDYLDGTTVHEAVTIHPAGRRGDVWLHPQQVLELDARTTREGHVTRSALIAALLAAYLEARAPKPTTQLMLAVPTDVWRRLKERGDPATVAVAILQTEFESVPEHAEVRV